MTLPSLILGTFSHSASASCQHGTPGKIIEDFWKITRGSRTEDLICFYFLCIREFRCLQFDNFLAFFCLGVSLHSSVMFHFTALVFLMAVHTVPLPVMSFACSNLFLKNGRAKRNPLLFWHRDWVLFRHINEYWSTPSLTSFPSLSCTPFTKATSRSSKAAHRCTLGKPAVNNCG